jgi:hypothetical protein
MINFNINFNMAKHPAPVAVSPYPQVDVNVKEPTHKVIRPKTMPVGTPFGTVKIS